MKLLIGYDGSTSAQGAIEDLRDAGLPEEAEATVLTAADLWPLRPNWSYEELSPGQRQHMPLSERGAYELAMHAMRQARAAATGGIELLRTLRPGWQARSRVWPGPPAEGLISVAAEQEVDLLLVGTRGRSAVRGLILGSVSRRVLTHADCNVRVGRAAEARADGPMRIILGMDGSENAIRAAQVIRSRRWPAGSEVHLVAALDVHVIASRCPVDLLAADLKPCDPDVDARTWLGQTCEAIAEQLTRTKLAARIVLKEGDAAAALLEEARSSPCACIFVGARGLRGLDRFLLGSVATTVAEHAPCSVEVVRRAPHDTAAGSA